MSRRQNQLLGYCLLCIVLVIGDEVVAQHEEATASESKTESTTESTTSKTAKTNSSENGKDKSEAVKDSTVKEDTVKDENAEKTDPLAVTKTSVLQISVMQNGMNGAPIKNARVIVTHIGGKEYRDITDDSGVVMLSNLPYGKIDVDVSSAGRISGAHSLELDEPKETLTFQLKARTLPEQ
ncbi:carboxypeptidase-like regulatory domain-containing protein [Kaarinaea lacus]